MRVGRLSAENSRSLLASRQLPRATIVFAALALSAAGCGGSSDPEPSADTQSDVPQILVTTGIWGDVVANVACGGIADVETVIPAGGDPHGFEPSLRDRERMENADLVVANGLSLETQLEDTLAAVEDSGTPVFRIAEQVETIAFSSGHAGEDDHADEDDHDDHDADHDADDDDHDADEDHDGHGHGSEDPHVWFDPVRVSGALNDLALHLTDDAGVHGDAVAACLSDYQAELAALDQELEDLLEELSADERKLVTNHDALAYFADRYGFEVIGTVLPSTSVLAETNPAQLEELAETIEHEGVKAVFAESVHSSDETEALASRVGDVEVVTLYTGSLGPSGSGAEDYVGFMRTNARLIVDALG